MFLELCQKAKINFSRYIIDMVNIRRLCISASALPDILQAYATRIIVIIKSISTERKLAISLLNNSNCAKCFSMGKCEPLQVHEKVRVSI